MKHNLYIHVNSINNYLINCKYIYRSIFTLSVLFFMNVECRSQYLTKEKIAFYTSSLTYCILEGVTEAYSIKEKQTTDPALRNKYMQTWHKTKFFREIATLATGYTIALDGEFDLLKTFSNLFVTASMSWIIHDEVINRINGWNNIPFGFTSQSAGVWKGNNGSFFDKFGTPLIKFTSLLLAIFINVLI